jgi:hypothetical protein
LNRRIFAALAGEQDGVRCSSRKWCGVLKQLAMTAWILVTLAGSTAEAQEACVLCTGPQATYRCTVEKSDKLAGLGAIGEKALQHVCAKELARQGGHATCSARRDLSGAACNGVPAEIPLASLLEGPATTAAAAPPAPVPTAPTQPAEAKTEPPRTVEELAKRASAKSKQQLKEVGDSVGTAANRTWTCLSSLFQRC